MKTIHTKRKIKSQNKSRIIGLKEFRNNTESYIRRLQKGESFAVVRRSEPVFKLTPIDKDDDSLWTTVVDFTKIRKGGVPAEEVLRALKNLDAKD